jgi:hypothetical protein
MTAQACLTKGHRITLEPGGVYVCEYCTSRRTVCKYRATVTPLERWIDHEHWWHWRGWDGGDNYYVCYICQLQSHDHEAYVRHREQRRRNVCGWCNKTFPFVSLLTSYKMSLELSPNPRMCFDCDRRIVCK